MEMERLIERALQGRYQIIGFLGDGGMGTVYRARDIRLQRDVAIKVMHIHLARRPDFRKRFLDEARNAARLDHPGIVRVHDCGTERSVVYIVMEYIPGDTLRERLDDLQAAGKPMPLPEAIQLIRQICRTLAYVHGRHILHRDIKPDNIILRPEAGRRRSYRPVLTDLGLAKLLEDGALSQTGMPMGTPAYMSPEHARGTATDARSDVYSLGVLLYELITGQLPFPIKTIEDAIRHHQAPDAPPPPAPHSLRPAVPESLSCVMLKALARDPAERYPDAGALKEALAAVLPPASALYTAKTVVPGEHGPAVPKPALDLPEVGQAEKELPRRQEPPASTARSQQGRSQALERRLQPRWQKNWAALAHPFWVKILVAATAVLMVSIIFGTDLIDRLQTGAQTTRTAALVLPSRTATSPSADLSPAMPLLSAPTASPTRPASTSTPAVPTPTPISPPAPGRMSTPPADMVLVEAGWFVRGSTAEEIEAIYAACRQVQVERSQALCWRPRSEQPQHRVYLDAFAIDRYEVTNAQYEECYRAQRCRAPAQSPSFDSVENGAYPVVGVTWFDAENYCRWRGKRLPTEAEWEKAARGPDGWLWPWGNSFVAGNANIRAFGVEPGRGRMVPSDSDRDGLSPYGAANMVGNVMEWVADFFGPYNPSENRNPMGPASGAEKVIRGGSWNTNIVTARPAARVSRPPDTAYPDVGFRCARSPQE